MIKIRLRSIGEDKPLEADIVPGETILEAATRALSNTPFEENIREHFYVVVNGHVIPKEMWEITKTLETDNILIAPSLKGDQQGLLRVVALIAVMIAAPYAAPGLAAATGLSVGAATGVITVLGSLAISALIPPADMKTGVNDAENSSQMYTLSSQSNKTVKLGFVPKVYGTHRMFPNVAANPYIRFETGSDGKLVQFLYAIYDFGLGPALIDEIRIGDTAIGDFADCDYRLVDLNKPSVSEGTWDDQTSAEFKYYKGDNNTEDVSVTFVKNQNDTPTPPEGDYRVVRNSAVNPNNASTEISLLLYAPQGLIGYASNGKSSARSVVFDIEFAKVGTEDWYPYNEFTQVIDYRSTGGDTLYSDFPAGFQYTDMVFIRQGLTRSREQDYTPDDPGRSYSYLETRFYGIPVGATSIILNRDPNIQYNTILRCAGEVIGRVASFDLLSGNRARYHFQEPISKTYEVAMKSDFYTVIMGETGPEGTTVETEWSTSRQIYRGVATLKRAVLKGEDTEPVYAVFKFWPRDPGQYKVRVTRVYSSSTYTYTVRDDVVWSSLTTSFDAVPILTEKRHVFLELRIRATNQLNGTISNLSASVTSVLDAWNGTAWEKKATSNPAWIYVDILSGEINKRPADKSRLHIESILEWADYCDEIPPSIISQAWVDPRFSCNFVLDFSSTLQQLVNRVSAASNASMNVIDGKYGVLIDRRKTIPSQIFTPRNSSNFSSSRSYPRPPHALEMQFVDPNINWDMGNIRVYADGFNFETATEIEEISTFGITSSEQAWRLGRYMLASTKLRQETISIDVDFEYLVCARGDYVQLVQDAMRAGGRASRVKTVVGNVVTLDDAYDNLPTPTWGYVFRSSVNGEIFSGVADPVDARSFELTGADMPLPGDLIVIGATDQVVLDCIVKAINPKDDFSATLTLVEKADAIHDSETGVGIPPYNPQLSAVQSQYVPPGQVENLEVTDSAYNCTGNGYEHYVVLDWDAPSGSTFEYFEVFVDWGDGYNSAGTTRESLYTYIVDNRNLDKPHNFKVLAVSSGGLKLDLTAVSFVSATPLDKITPPSNVTVLQTNITNEVLELKWDRVLDCDIREYFLRYSPITNGGSWPASTPLPRADRNTTSMAVQARTGTYFIKAVDFNGNESAVAAIAITTVPNLFALNIIDEVSDTPLFGGSKDRVVKIGSSIMLAKETVGSSLDQQSYYSEGYYYFKEIVDLGEIYTCRVQSNIQAAGFTEEDLVGNWDPLSDVDALATATVSDWDVITEYRVSNIRNVMEDWVHLEDIDPLNEGVDAFFSEWRPFTMGDITGRVIQFRLKLVSLRASVTPRVFDGTIKVDMPDRTDSFNDMTSPVGGGIYLPFTPPFKGPGNFPNAQVSIDGAESGDYWEYSERDLNGIRIEFFDESGTPVERTFDLFVKGYGAKNNEII